LIKQKGEKALKLDQDPNNLKNLTGDLSELVGVMNKLLSPNGCPWDREQTHQTLAPYAIEEAHELAEALENNDIPSIKEELGDFMFQVIFHCALGEKNKTFDFKDVVKSICTKLITRHPHVFGDVKVKDSAEVLKNWDEIKKEEKKNKTPKHFDIPLALPALQRAQKIGDKTRNLKFDWQNSSEVFLKVDEEIAELKEAMDNNDKPAIEEELGDVFFVLAQLARHLKLDAETIARNGNKKFEKRFDKLMKKVEMRKLNFNNLTVDEKEMLWQEAKRDK
jgi:tetrapyrrole methylase family protein/MazG family protein